MQLIPDSIEIKVAVISERPDGIVLVQIKNDVEIGVQEINEMYAAFLKLTGGRKFVTLVYSGQGAHSTKEAREVASNHAESKLIVAEAILVDNLPHKLLATFYIKVHTPKRFTKIFTKETEAVKWLKKFDTTQ